MKSFTLPRRVIKYEVLTFLALIAFVWIDELADFPRLLLDSPTPVNWRESLLETAVIAIAGVVCVVFTRRLLNRIRSLEGLLPICAHCKRIRDPQGNWHPMETFISQRSQADFTHGICPRCAEILYPGTGTGEDRT